MIIKNVFELTAQEIKLVEIAKNDMLETNWSKDGKKQEKGEAAEQLVLDLLSLCEGVKVMKSEVSSALDEVLKVDVVVERIYKEDEEEFDKVFAFQVKCNEYGANNHFSKYGDEIKYKNHYFRTPWCLVVKSCYSNKDLLNILIDNLTLDCELDWDKLELIQFQIKTSNGERLPMDKFNVSKKERVALRVLYNISKFKKTLYLKLK